MVDIIQVGIIPFPVAGGTFKILQENGDAVLQETADFLLTEDA